MQVDVPKEEVDPLRDMLDDAAEQDDDKALAAFFTPPLRSLIRVDGLDGMWPL